MKKILVFMVLLLAVSSLSVLAQECIDSDGGVNPLWKGMVSDSGAVSGSLKEDNCFDRNTLWEYSCDNTEGEKIDCEFGCSEGECKQSGSIRTVNTCYDSDPADDKYTVGSVAYGNLNEVKRDYCFDKVTLFEQNCKGGIKIPCERGCNPKGYCEQRGVLGQKQKKCIDSDGKDFFVQGQVSHPTKISSDIQRDYCIEEDVLIEQTCDGTFRVECPNGCAHGECLEPRTELEGKLVEDAAVKLREEAVTEDEAEEEETGDLETDTTENSSEDEKKSRTWLWVIIVVIVLAIIYFAMGKDGDEKKKED